VVARASVRSFSPCGTCGRDRIGVVVAAHANVSSCSPDAAAVAVIAAAAILVVVVVIVVVVVVDGYASLLLLFR
jgi:hypothetical protein